MVLVRHEAGAFAQTSRAGPPEGGAGRRPDRGASWPIWRRCTTWCTTRWRTPPSTWRRRSAPCARGQRHARPGAPPAGAEPAVTPAPARARARSAWGSCSWSAPDPAARLDPGHPHLSRRVGPGEPRSCCPPPWPTCSAPIPFDFLYGNIAADSSIAKHYAPLGRHCHYWHVGQEIHDLAESDALRAFGLGYLCHLAADTVAHNYFVPRQLMLTSSTAAVGHSYWETRVESPSRATRTRGRPRT